MPPPDRKPEATEQRTDELKSGQQRADDGPKSSWLVGLTSNAAVSALLAAIVSGAVSFGVAHQQDQDAATQVISQQRVAEALQLETAATGLYEATFNLWSNCVKNGDACLDNPSYKEAVVAFVAARVNFSDPRASALALLLADESTAALDGAGNGASTASLTPVGQTYEQLMARCGQFVTALQ
jgi:hypothetical protein